MRISTVGARITCYRDDRAKLELADGRTFDADKIHLRTLGGTVIASPVTCDLFALPKSVELVPRENARLYDVGAAARKVRRQAAAAEDACRRFRIGRRFGNERLLTDEEVEKLGEKIALLEAKRAKSAKATKPSDRKRAKRGKREPGERKPGERKQRATTSGRRGRRAKSA